MKIIEPYITVKKEGEASFDYFNKLLYTSVSNSDYPAWSPTKEDYKIEDIVYFSSLKREYICLKDGTRQNPTTSGDWEDMGAENNYKMFDSTLFTQTESEEDIEVRFQSRYENFLTFHNLENITHITISQKDTATDTNIFDETISLIDYGVDTFWEYCYTDAFYSSEHGIEVDSGLDIETTITFAGVGTRKVGTVILGNMWDYGCVMMGAKITGENLAKFKDNGYIVKFQGKGVVRGLSGKVYVPVVRADRLVQKLDKIANQLNVYWLDDDERVQDITMVLGYHGDYSFVPTKASRVASDFKVTGVK